MPKVVVNSTPIISLSIIDQLDLLKKLYNEIYIPQAVYDEVCVKGESQIGAKTLQEANFIKTLSIKNDEARRFFSASLHRGEVEVMILAQELEADLLIIDDYQARKHAKYLDFKITGTLGILIKSKEANHIKKIKPLVDRLIENDIYIGDNLYRKILDLADED
jgi:predicted nucleic acid-binding protein